MISNFDFLTMEVSAERCSGMSVAFSFEPNGQRAIR
jgi:hypothetical protein